MLTLALIGFVCYLGWLVFGYRPGVKKVGIGYGGPINKDAAETIVSVQIVLVILWVISTLFF